MEFIDTDPWRWRRLLVIPAEAKPNAEIHRTVYFTMDFGATPL
jgi:hypothetical protein